VLMLVVAALAVPLWLRPLLMHQAVTALGRPVAIGTAGLGLTLDPLALVFHCTDVTIGNPADFPAGEPPFAHAAAMTMAMEVLPALRGGPTTLTLLDLHQPMFSAIETADGKKNFVFQTHPAAIRQIRVSDGRAHVVLPALHADLQAQFATQASAEGPGKTVTTAQGTYAGLPATLRLISDAAFQSGVDAKPLAMTLQVVDGRTTLDADGTLRDPISPTGADLAMRIAGPDMALLKPLLGIAFPHSATYSFDGGLHYSPGLFRVTGKTFTIGQSDLEGAVTVRTGSGRPPDTIADLTSRVVTAADARRLLAGDAGPGANPGLPKSGTGALHLTYRAQAVHDGTTTLGALDMHLELSAEGLVLKPLTLGIGAGQFAGAVTLKPQPDGALHADARLWIDRVDIARLGPRAEDGAGAISGVVHLKGSGPSAAAILGSADGEAAFWMQDGQLGSLFLDLAGLRLGNALLAWVTGPRVTRVDCFAADLPIRHGVITTRALILETADAVMQGNGTLSLADKRMDLRLQTHSKHLTVGVIPGPLVVSGPLDDLSALPDPAAGPARHGLAAVLSVLPGVQFGVGDASRCDPMLDRLRAAAGSP
jgi:uncharacterized protein involved in outer membrane biogenesis